MKHQASKAHRGGKKHEHLVEYRIESEDEDSYGEYIANKRNAKKGMTGVWTEEERNRYVLYVSNNLDVFQNSLQRRNRKIFEGMSKRIRTRNPNQCRSHHQKMMIKYQT